MRYAIRQYFTDKPPEYTSVHDYLWAAKFYMAVLVIMYPWSSFEIVEN